MIPATNVESSPSIFNTITKAWSQRKKILKNLVKGKYAVLRLMGVISLNQFSGAIGLGAINQYKIFTA